MKPGISQWTRFGSAVAAAVMLNAAIAFAADEPAPAPQPQQPDASVRANRERAARGNVAVDPAQDRRGGSANFGGGRGGFGLNLDEKQNELLREAMQAEGEELRKLTEKLQAAQKELIKAVIAEKYDEASVRAKADAVSRIQTDMTVLRARAFGAVAPTLKPEQRDQIENNRAAAGIITGAGLAFGGGPQDQNFRRGDRGNNPAPGGDPNQGRRRDRTGGPGQ